VGFPTQSWAVGTATRTARDENDNCNGGATLTNLNMEIAPRACAGSGPIAARV